MDLSVIGAAIAVFTGVGAGIGMALPRARPVRRLPVSLRRRVKSRACCFWALRLQSQ